MRNPGRVFTDIVQILVLPAAACLNSHVALAHTACTCEASVKLTVERAARQSPALDRALLTYGKPRTCSAEWTSLPRQNAMNLSLLRVPVDIYVPRTGRHYREQEHMAISYLPGSKDALIYGNYFGFEHAPDGLQISHELNEATLNFSKDWVHQPSAETVPYTVKAGSVIQVRWRCVR
jgi:hypothetical protein